MSAAATSSTWDRVVGVAPGAAGGGDGMHMPLPVAQAADELEAGQGSPSSDENGEADGDAGDLGNDAEGVWSPDIERSFQEALAIYPPCGRRKIILSDEGKMYGRNELIARYIKLRTGKVRTRKQVSSHIQVLARKKARELQSRLKETTNNKEQEVLQGYLQSLPNLSSAQIVSSAFNKNNGEGAPAPGENQAQLAAANATPGASVAATNVAATAAVATASPASHAVAALPMGRSSPAMLIKQEAKSISNAVPNAVSPAMWLAGGAPAAATAMAGPMYGEMMYSRSLGAPGMASPPPGYVVASPMHNAAMQRLHIPSPPLGAALSVSPVMSAFRLVDFNTYVEFMPDSGDSPMQHLFVHIGLNTNFSDPNMEAIGISQIADKFPSLKEMFDKGPQSAFFLVKFWADMNVPMEVENRQSSYGSSATYESSADVTCSCSTKVCSFGQQVVEKVETQRAVLEGGRYVVRLHRSPMCEYMINFIHKLRALPERSMMNSVLENFTILQLVVNRETNNLLLCLAFVFEVSNEQGSYHHIYRLAKD